MNDLRFGINCNCGGSLNFNINTVSFDKEYLCPNCSENLGVEVIDLLVNVRDSLIHHCENCTPLNNVRGVSLRGQLIK